MVLTFSSFALCQGADNLTKAKQTFVDADTFFQELSCRTGLLDSFWTSQIYKVKFGWDLFGDLFWLFSFFLGWSFDLFDDLLLNGNGEDGMGSGADCVHVGWTSLTILDTHI